MPRQPESPDSKPTHQALRHVAKVPESQLRQSSAGLSVSPEPQAPVSSCLLTWLPRALRVLRPKQELVCDLPGSRRLLPCLLPSLLPSFFLPSFLSLLNLLQHCFCFLFWVFLAPRQCGILAPQAGMESTPPALEGKVLTPELPGNSPYLSYSRKGYLHSPSGSLPISHHQLSVLALKSFFHPSAFSTCTVMIFQSPQTERQLSFPQGLPDSLFCPFTAALKGRHSNIFKMPIRSGQSAAQGLLVGCSWLKGSREKMRWACNSLSCRKVRRTQDRWGHVQNQLQRFWDQTWGQSEQPNCNLLGLPWWSSG